MLWKSVGLFVQYLVLCILFSGLRFSLCLQAAAAAHVGVDNFDVVGHVGRLVEAMAPRNPFAFLDDGDLLLICSRDVG